MIRGNYSLAKEVRKNEQKSKQKIQSRQKHQSKIEQLSSADPIRLFFQVEKLEKIVDPDPHQQKRLSKLRQDWAFIQKNKLHNEKVSAFLENRQKVKDAREKEQRKLRGKDSVYFNPELNPLGKVPDTSNMAQDYTSLPNIPKPVRSFHTYEQDPLILKLNIKPPQGSPPKFYKNVQNIQRKTYNPSENPQEPVSKTCRLPTDYKSTNLDTDSNYESHSDD
ncbi:hypothetical protein JCM33374_g111 [Metschnikowia sp. JCM 33374]|nr:hypothetical protein JCM33374_g111 [Metschnikowia sp. JCM 33374]